MSGRPNSNIYSHKHMVLCDINPNSTKDSVKFVTHEDFVLCDIDPARGGVRTVETDRRFSRLVDLHPGQMFAHFHAKINRAFESSTFNLSPSTSCSWAHHCTAPGLEPETCQYFAGIKDTVFSSTNAFFMTWF